ncbi:MAG: FHA domain-containing protein [Cyanobacteria bacterium P01_A01_bin.17]
MVSLPHSRSRDFESSSIETPQLLLNSEAGLQAFRLSDLRTWTLGRNQTNTICLKDPCTSRCHARIDVQQNHDCYFIDLGSANGSSVNEQPVTEPVLLKHGDRIKIGQTDLLFQHRPSPKTDAYTLVDQVLMLHISSVQGKVWQDIFCSQQIPVVWGNPGVSLRQTVEFSAMSCRLPKILLVDIAAYRNHFGEFCRWCTVQYPQMSIVFFDRKQAAPKPSATLLPHVHRVTAFPERHLFQHLGRIEAQTQQLLQLYDGRGLRSHPLH